MRRGARRLMRSGAVVVVWACVLSVALLWPQGAGMAQTDPAVQQALARVTSRIQELEAELDIPSHITRLLAPDADRDQVITWAGEIWDAEMQELSDWITLHPEVGFEEFQAVAKLTEALQQRGFTVETGVAGLPTAFVARWPATVSDSAVRLGIIVEYDALRGTERPFHGDQHSAQGPIGLSAAFALQRYLQQSGHDAQIIVYGTPAEEIPPPSKAIMHEAGVFDEADIIVRSHSSRSTSRNSAGFGTCCLNINAVKYTFTGRPAHQLASWNGRNALEAVIHFFNLVDGIRSSIRPEARIQGVILEGGVAPNVVPDRAVADFFIRYPDPVYLEHIQRMVDNAARAAALGTGTQVTIERYGIYRDGISLGTLEELAFAYAKQLGAENIVEQPERPSAYEETGTVSSAIPGVGVSVRTSAHPAHTYEMEQDALSEIGHKGFRIAAQVMAAVLYDFLTDLEFRQAVKTEFAGIRALYQDYLDALRNVYASEIDTP